MILKMRNFGPELEKSDIFVQCRLGIRIEEFDIITLFLANFEVIIIFLVHLNYQLCFLL